MEAWVLERLNSLPVSAVEQCGSYRFSVEPLVDSVWEEVEALGAKHFVEMAAHHLGEAYFPDKEGRQIDCAMGRLFACVVRDKAGVMVGYALLYLFRNRNSQQTQVREDALFIDPPHRRGRLNDRFMTYLHALAKKAGATKSRIQVCIGARNRRYVESIGYREIATIMEKDL